MKKLSIVVRSEKLDDVKAILDECGSTGAMVSNIMGYGNQKGYKTTYRGSEYVVNLIPKVKIETIAKDEIAEDIISKICERISTGKFGDGKIFVSNISDVVRIRTGERGEGAL
jgi:nitrogen regulatory protein P-II 1